MATQLHEILAVETGLGETANRVQKGTTQTLESKRSIFSGLTKEHVIFGEEKQHLKQATEIVEVQDTVAEQLSFAAKEISQYWDVILQKEEANQRAKADIIINGEVIAANVPAIVLLSMEKKLNSLLGMYNVIPTLDAARSWSPSPEYSKANVFRTAHAVETQQTETVKDWKEVSAATKEHKAQLAEVVKTNIVGKYIRFDYSGCISSFDKAEKLARLTALIKAVKQARQRANTVEVNSSLRFGMDLFNYING